MAKTEIGTAERIRRNRNAFRRWFPYVWEQISTIEDPVSKLVEENGRPVNIDLGDISLYPDPAPDWTAVQLQGFFEDPDRIGFFNPSHCNISPVSFGVLREIVQYFEDNPGKRGAAYPMVDIGFAFLFGIGLGYHVEEFIRRKAAYHIILIEPFAEFLVHSMAAIDWWKIFRDARRKGIYLHFLVGQPPAEIVKGIENVVMARGSTFLDGSYAYVHYFAWPLKEARTLLNERIKVFYLSSGFFEDEILMMRNTYYNLRGPAFRLVDRKRHHEQSTPVFIVGSGPSLDRDIAAIKKWRDRVIVFSCGTAIGILLKNGIRPDLHVENENTFPLVKNLREFKNRYGFEGIRLVATTTVRPEAAELFDSKWLYFRSPLSCTLLTGGTEPLPFAEPLVPNAACAVMSALGFKNITLFGVDCGRQFDGEHHSRDAVYYEDFFDIDPNDRPDAGFERVVQGNFGGEVLTSWSLDLSRWALSTLMESRGLSFVNCSNGARIDGARPKVSGALDLSHEPVNMQEKVLRSVEESMRLVEPGELLEASDIAEHAAACDDFRVAFDALIDAAKEEDTGFWDLERRTENFWTDDWSEYKGVLKIIGGSYASMVRLGAYGGSRITSRKARRDFFRFFLERYRESCQWMAAEAKILLTDIAEGKDELTEIGNNAPFGSLPRDATGPDAPKAAD